MYLETGLGQGIKPQEKGKTKQPPREPPRPKDIFRNVTTEWDLMVPFRKDFAAFRQEVVKAVGRHVAASEKTKIAPNILYPDHLTKYHTFYSQSAHGLPESAIVTVRVILRFTNNNHTGFEQAYIDLSLLPVTP
jgi:hypothetical protein